MPDYGAWDACHSEKHSLILELSCVGQMQLYLQQPHAYCKLHNTQWACSEVALAAVPHGLHLEL